MKLAQKIPRVSEVIPSWNRDGEELKEGGLQNTLQTDDHINNTANTTVENESFLTQAITGVVFTLAPLVVFGGIAAISVDAADACSSTATCSTDFGGNLMCLTTW